VLQDDSVGLREGAMRGHEEIYVVPRRVEHANLFVSEVGKRHHP